MALSAFPKRFPVSLAGKAAKKSAVFPAYSTVCLEMLKYLGPGGTANTCIPNKYFPTRSLTFIASHVALTNLIVLNLWAKVKSDWNVSESIWR